MGRAPAPLLLPQPGRGRAPHQAPPRLLPRLGPPAAHRGGAPRGVARGRGRGGPTGRGAVLRRRPPRPGRAPAPPRARPLRGRGLDPCLLGPGGAGGRHLERRAGPLRPREPGGPLRRAGRGPAPGLRAGGARVGPVRPVGRHLLLGRDGGRDRGPAPFSRGRARGGQAEAVGGRRTSPAVGRRPPPAGGPALRVRPWAQVPSAGPRGLQQRVGQRGAAGQAREGAGPPPDLGRHVAPGP